MISIVYSTRTPNNQFQEHIKKSVGVKEYEIYEIVNDGTYENLYNKVNIIMRKYFLE